MPRIYNKEGHPFDYCKFCMLSEEQAEIEHNHDKLIFTPDNGGFGYDSEHPEYEYTEYKCDECEDELTEADN
jgi:hypothetical protein